jgi:osmoprotectant transport system permease protein
MIHNFLDFLVTNRAELLDQTLEHLWLTFISVTLATIIGILLGIFIVRYSRFASPVLWMANTVQTIPSIALLGILLPFVGIGALPAIIALFLYGLLPIIRNTHTGITGVNTSVREAAVGMGLTQMQLLGRVELPLALPVIFAGIRTAFVINVGVATLCALIAAGGLGEFIFRGLATNNSQMILAGAIPAALIALFFDWMLGYVQRHLNKLLFPIIVMYALAIGFVIYLQIDQKSDDRMVVAGFPSEFLERGDGYEGLKKVYNLNLHVREMEIGLMYQAVQNGDVDVISGFSTDGRIEAFDLVKLTDDQNYFPPYHAAPLVRRDLLRRFPELESLFKKIEGSLTDSLMTSLNFRVDERKEDIRSVAREYLNHFGIPTVEDRKGDPDVIIGSKNFTESFILAEIFSQLIESQTSLNVELKMGFGGTKLLFDALKAGEVDMYPEYTGTGLLVILQPSENVLKNLPYERDRIYDFVRREFAEKYEMQWLSPLGFNNTFALMTSRNFAEQNNLRSITDLARLSRE